MEVGVQLHSFVNIQLSQHLLKRLLSPPLNCLDIFIENHSFINMVAGSLVLDMLNSRHLCSIFLGTSYMCGNHVFYSQPRNQHSELSKQPVND